MKRSNVIKLAVVALLVGGVSGAWAAAMSWEGDVSSNFSDANNWAGGILPHSGEGNVDDLMVTLPAIPGMQRPVLSDGSSWTPWNIMFNPWNWPEAAPRTASLEISNGMISAHPDFGGTRMGLWAGDDVLLTVGASGTLHAGWELKVGEVGSATINQTGGLIRPGSTTHFGMSSGAAGVLNLSGGTFESFWVNVGTVAGASGEINISGGELFVNGGINFGAGSGVINMSGTTGTINLFGDQTATVAQWIADGDLTGDVVYDFDTTATGRTVVTAIPEPATLGLLALCGGLMIGVRRLLI